MAFFFVPMRSLGGDAWKIAAALMGRHIGGGNLFSPCIFILGFEPDNIYYHYLMSSDFNVVAVSFQVSSTTLITVVLLVFVSILRKKMYVVVARVLYKGQCFVRWFLDWKMSVYLLVRDNTSSILWLPNCRDGCYRRLYIDSLALLISFSSLMKFDPSGDLTATTCTLTFLIDVKLDTESNILATLTVSDVIPSLKTIANFSCTTQIMNLAS